MSSKKSLAARLLTRAFRTRPAAPIVRPTGPVGGRIEELEDRSVPALVAYYTFDNSANLGQDSSGNSNNLVNTGSPVFTTQGVYGGALSMNGTANYLSQGALFPTGVPTGGAAYTVAAWFNADGTPGFAEGIIGWGNYGTTNETNALRMSAVNQVVNYWWANDLFATAPATLYAGTAPSGWHHVAATYDPGTLVHSIYIDGNLRGQRTVSAPNVQPVNFTVGKTVNFEYFNGLLDDVRVYNNALTGAEVASLAHAPSYYAAEGNAIDSTAGRTGTFSAPAVYTTGVVGQAFSFNTTNQVTVNANPAFDFTTGTVTAYFNAPADGNNRGILSMRTNNLSPAGTRWSIHVNEAGNSIGLFNGTTYQTVPAVIDPGTWYHLAAVMTPSSTTFYLNGVSLGTTGNVINAGVTGKPFVIGTPNDPGYLTENFGGQIDEVRVFGRALTPAEIAATMATGTLTATLSAGVLTVTDINGSRNNALTVAVSGPNLVVTDAAEAFTTTGTGTFSVPLASVTSLVLNTAGGNDAVTLSYAGGSLPTISYDGGAGGSDKLITTGGTVASATHTFTGAQSGNIQYTGAGLVSYSGLEPVDESGMVVPVRVFNLPAGANTATLANTGANLLLSSSLPTFEATTFANPATSLTINGAGNDDSLTVNNATNLSSGLSVGPAGAFSAIAVQNGALNLGTNAASLTAGTIALNSALSANGGITLVAGTSVTQSQPLTTTGTLTLGGAGNAATYTLGTGTNQVGTATAVTTGSVTLFESGGGVVLAGGNVGGTFTINTSGGITQTAAVTAGVMSLSNGGGGSILLNGFANPITSFSAGNFAGGSGSLAAQFGSGTTITSAHSSSGTVTFTNTNGSILTLSGPVTTGGGAVSFPANTSSLDIGPGATINTIGGAVTVSRSINADSAASNRTLSITADTGAVTLGNVGATRELGTFTVVSSGTGSAIGVVSTRSGGVSITSTGMTLNGNVTTNGLSTAGPIALSGAFTLGTGVTISSDATTTDAAITFATGSSVTGAQTLALNAGSANVVLNNTTFGTPTALTSLSITAADVTGTGTIATTGGVTVTNTGAASSLGGTISNTGGLTKAGAGTLTVAGANTYGGATTVSAGSLRLGAAGVIPNTSDVALTGTLDLNGFSETIDGLTGTGTVTSGVVGAAALTIGSNNEATPNFSGVIQNGSGTVALTKIGTGVQTLSGGTANTFTGLTTVSAGRLHLNKSAGNNAIGGNLSITTGGQVTFGANHQIVDSAAVSMSGAASQLNGTAVNTGQFNLTETIASLTVTGGTFNTAADGIWTITGAGSFSGGAGNTIFLGNSGTRLTFGSLSISNMTATAGATVGTINSFTLYGNNTTRQSTITVGAGGLSLDVSVFNLRRGGASTFGSRLVLNGDVTSTATGASSIIEDTAGGTTGSISVDLGGATRTFTVADGAAATDFSINVPVQNGALTKAGAGVMNLTAANTYTGTTDVTAGRLNVNGSVTSNVAVNGGVLGGTGTINSANTLTLNTGTVAPGTSPGILNSGSVTFVGGTFQVEVNGTTLGSQYDQLNVTGTVTLGAGTTALSLPTPTFNAGFTYTIINNDGTENVTGYFTGFPEGAEVASFGVGGKVYITYAGGDGNDVQLLTTPTVNGTAGDDIIIFRVAVAPAGTYEVSIDNGATFANLGPITTVTINGQGGDDTLIIDAVNGNPFLTGGITYNGGAHTSPNPGDVLQVVNGTYTTITHNFLTASSGNIDFDGRVVNYTGLEPVLVNVGTVTDVIFNLPAGPSTAVLEDDGTTGNTLVRLRSTNGTFETTTFDNPTGSVTINRGNAADTLDVTAIADLTSTLTIGTVGSPFSSLNVTGGVSLGTDKNFTSFGTTTTISAPVSVGGTGAVSMTAGQNVSVSANVTGGTGGVTLTGQGAAALNTVGVAVQSGAVVTATGAGPVNVNGTGGGLADTNFGVEVEGTITSGGGPVQVTGVGGSGTGFGNNGVQVAGGVISAGSSGTVIVDGTGGSGVGAQRVGVLVTTGGTITSSGGTITISGTGGSASTLNGQGVGVFQTGTISAPGALNVTGTKGANTTQGIWVTEFGTNTITSGGVATLTGLSASDVVVDTLATANFGSLTVSAAGATVTIFEDSTTAVNTISATIINLTSAGAITDNNLGANNLTGTTATLAAEAGGIDLDTTLGSLIATTSLPGNILIDELDAITLTNVTSADGNITITAGGTVSAVNVEDTLDAAHVVSITTTAGDILVGNVSAVGDTVTLNAAAAIEELTPLDGTADITAHVINLTAVTGIGAAGTVEIDTITTLGHGLTASVTGTGLINLADTAGGLSIESATTANGSITITAAAGDMIVETVTAGTASAVNLSTTTSGSILDDDVDTTRITGGAVTFTAVGSVGTGATAVSEIDTAAASITASAEVVWIGELDAVTLTSVSAAPGSVIVVSGNTMTVVSVSAAGNAALSATTGDVLLGAVTATGLVFVNAAGAVVDNNGSATNITSTDVMLTAGTGVGSADAIETTALSLAGTNTASGAFNVANTGSLAIRDNSFTTPQLSGAATGVTNTGGAIDISTGNATSNALLSVIEPVSGTGNVVLTSDQNFSLDTGIAVTSSGGTVAINADVVADADTTGATVNINGQVTSGLAAANAVTINTGGDADTITVRRTSASNVDVYAGGIVAPATGFDQVTVVLGALGSGFVRLNNSGNDNYRATINGAAQVVPLTFHANDVADQNGVAIPGAAGPRRVAVPIGTSTTVLDYRPAGASLNVLTLLGGTAADTYFVQFTDPAVVAPSPSLLPPLVNVNAAGAGDTANVYGTNAGDTIGINEASSDQVTSAGVTVQYDGNLETLNMFGKDEPNVAPPTPTFGDTFNLRPDTLTQINVSAGTPTLYPGDTLNLDVVPYVLNDPTFVPALPIPDGLIGFSGGGAAQTVTWTGIENFPVPLGMGGSFDFEATRNASRPFGYRSVIPSDNYAPAIGFGWDTPLPQYGIQVADVGPGTVVGNGDTVFGPLSSPLGMLYRDYAYGWNSPADHGIFRVAVIPNKPVQVTAYLGAPTVIRDGQVVEWSNDGTTWTLFTPATGITTLPGETMPAGGVVTPTGTNLYVRFRDVSGEVYWSVAGLDVRPTNPGSLTGTGALVAPLPIRQEFSTATPLVTPPAPGVGFASGQAFAAVDADGVTIDYYRGKDAIPNSILTITATNGTPVDALYTAADNTLSTRVLNADVAGYVVGFQVQADGNGEFTFGVRRPTGTATSTIQVTDATGFRADRFTQAFQLPTTRRIDFGPLPAVSIADYGNGGTVQSYVMPAPANAFSAGYLPFASAAHSGATALGWSTMAPLPVPFTPGGTGATAVQADGVFGGYAPSEFVLDVPGTNYVVTATLGDLSARRDDIFVEVLTTSGWVLAKGYNPATGAYDLDLTGLTSPPGVSPNAGQSLSRTFLATAVGGQVRMRFGNVTGNPYWSLASLEVRPTQAALTVTPPGGTLPANGFTPSNFSVNTAAVPNGTLLTVRVGAGQVVGTDQSNTYDGFQILSTGATTTISVIAPNSATAITSFLEVETLTGEARGAASQAYSAVAAAPAGIQRFDFNGPTNTLATGLTAVRGNLLQSTSGAPVPAYPSNPVNVDYGWTFPVGEFDRNPATLPASMTADQKALFQDGVSLNATKATFRVKVGSGQYGVRYYIGDSAKKWPWIQIQVEGQNNTPAASTGQLRTNQNQYWSYVLQGSDTSGDGYLDISIFGANVWVLNGLDVAAGGIASLPPSLFAPSPQRAAFTVTSGTAPKLTQAELAPIVAEAVQRWAAAGVDPARLAGVTLSITDLNDAGRLGEHVPGSVHIDDDAGGRGWFVDATPGDDAEFGASVSVGLGATDSSASRRVDLLTVVMHELGHELGLADVSPSAAPSDLMAETLDVGVRRLPAGLSAVVATPPLATVSVSSPALWLVESESMFAPGVSLSATADRVPVLGVEPVAVRAEPTRLALAPTLRATPAWPDADALLDLDGVYVG